jgi:hypothetical protein
MSARDTENFLARQPVNETDEVLLGGLWEAWRLAELESGFALDAWYSASKGGKARAYAAYTAALELEALAADALAQSLEQSSDLGVERALAAP